MYVSEKELHQRCDGGEHHDVAGSHMQESPLPLRPVSKVKKTIEPHVEGGELKIRVVIRHVGLSHCYGTVED